MLMEIEATLIIQSERPDEIVRSISGLTAIGDYGLIHEKPKIIQDVYFDTLDGGLSKRRIPLRLRGLDGEYWITMKGRSRLNKWGALEHSELELTWSKEALERIFRELADVGVVLNQLGGEFDNINPMALLLKAGLKPIQDRETYRLVRDVVMKDDSLAEMAIDSVTYHFGEISICHYEMEIERKRGNDEIFMALIDNLLAMYKPYLRRWRYGKLVTGKGIERLLKDGVMGKLMGENNSLKPAGYKVLEVFLDSGLV